MFGSGQDRLKLGEMEHFFTCPYCWRTISMVLDISVPEQTYVEDCEVCCQPIEVSYAIEDGDLTGFEARVLE
jgi:transcription elongation factor Elf1